LEAKSYQFGAIYEVPLELAVLKLFSFRMTMMEKKEPSPSKEDTTMGKKVISALMILSLLAFGSATPVLAQQDGLVNVEIGDVTILEEVDVAVAANVVANVCAMVVADVLVLAQQVDATGIDFVCTQRGSRRTVAITDN
jgi:hypothetical protein